MATAFIPPLLAVVARNFGPEQIRRGADLVARGAVQIVSRAEREVGARSGAPDAYLVRIAFEGAGLQAGCSCPVSRGTSPSCEHIWSVLLVLARDTDFLADLDPAYADKSRRWLGTLSVVGERIRVGRLAQPRRSEEPLVYVALPGAEPDGSVVVLAGTRRARPDGSPGPFRTLKPEALRGAPRGDETDRATLAMLAGVDGAAARATPGFVVPLGQSLSILGPLARRGRLYAKRPRAGDDSNPVGWRGRPYRTVLELRADAEGSFRAVLALDGGERLELPDPDVALLGATVNRAGVLAPLADAETAHWVGPLRERPLAGIRPDELDEFLTAATRLGGRLSFVLPASCGVRTVHGLPVPRVVFYKPAPRAGTTDLTAELVLDYAGVAVSADPGASSAFIASERALVQRDVEAEAHWLAELDAAGLPERVPERGERPARTVSPRRFPALVSDLVQRGFHVQAEELVYRQARAFSASIAESSHDWFDVFGTVDFAGLEVPFPRVLAALRKKERLVDLGDGAFGVLPEEWLARFRLLGELGTLDGGRLRFGRAQVLLLDEILGRLPTTTADAAFANARQRLERFDGIGPVEPSPAFRGELRPYQKEGLGWMRFLEDFGFGGCLADDMGLGKTVQVLALLAGRAGSGRTSLVVAPRSLLSNWQDEAARFAPELGVLVHAGSGRATEPAGLTAHDLVLTTYGTMRRDVELLRRVELDYLVLDEAQAIKNSATDAARAARQLVARNRLSLSGTPIENHLGELMSQMDFLNPGLFGSHPVASVEGLRSRPHSVELAGILRGVLRPFLLRRTKTAVAPQLPARTEQTLSCELDTEQRALYDELRNHYRARLIGVVAKLSAGQERMLVLEALLRLRQVACHPALVDRTRADAPCAKLDVLMPALTAVTEEGHKALVFSQFTSLLSLVRERLDRADVAYEYLDGQTRDRGARVRRFQEDPSVKVFLISLRAGGLGLNLTAAEYVYILDPWWNPAVEAQAIDRAHRIGQERPVFAYRLVARDTVEERILELQRTKRELAEAILSEEAGPLARLTREDLEALLG